MPDLAQAYFDAGNLELAAERARDCRTTTQKDSGPNHGGAIHFGNIVLGRVALSTREAPVRNVPAPPPAHNAGARIATTRVAARIGRGYAVGAGETSLVRTAWCVLEPGRRAKAPVRYADL